jgi:hypothetical protein
MRPKIPRRARRASSERRPPSCRGRWDRRDIDPTDGVPWVPDPTRREQTLAARRRAEARVKEVARRARAARAQALAGDRVFDLHRAVVIGTIGEQHAFVVVGRGAKETRCVVEVVGVIALARQLSHDAAVVREHAVNAAACVQHRPASRCVGDDVIEALRRVHLGQPIHDVVTAPRKRSRGGVHGHAADTKERRQWRHACSSRPSDLPCLPAPAPAPAPAPEIRIRGSLLSTHRRS